MGMDGARDSQCETHLGRRAGCAQDLDEVQHRAEVARLELERSSQVVQALGVSTQKVIQHGALVPRLGKTGKPSQQRSEARVGDIETLRGDVAGGELESLRGRMMRVMHPHVPDALFGRQGFGGRATRKAAEELVEERRSADRLPRAIAADQPEDFNQRAILVEIA